MTDPEHGKEQLLQLEPSAVFIVSWAQSMRIKNKTKKVAVSSEGIQYRQQRTRKTCSEFILLQGDVSAEFSKGSSLSCNPNRR